MKLMNKDLTSRSGCTGLRKGTGKGLTQGQGTGTNNFKTKTKLPLCRSKKLYGKMELWLCSFFNLGWRRVSIFTPQPQKKKEALIFKSQSRHSSPGPHIIKLWANYFSRYYKIHQFSVVSFPFRFFSSQFYQAVVNGFIMLKRSLSKTHDKCLSYKRNSMRRHSAKKQESLQWNRSYTLKRLSL